MHHSGKSGRHTEVIKFLITTFKKLITITTNTSTNTNITINIKDKCPKFKGEQKTKQDTSKKKDETQAL